MKLITLSLLTISSPLWAQGWIVKLNRTQSAQSFLRGHGFKGRILDSKTSSRWLKIEEPRGALSVMSQNSLADIEGVEYVERDQKVYAINAPARPADPADPAVGQPAITPNDPSYSKLWGLADVSVKGSTRAPHAWYHLRNRTLSTVVVGVLDTGVKYSHQDLKPILYTAKLNGVTVQGIDAVHKDYVADDDNSHGSHVSGTIAAKANNGVGVTGVAPNAKIFPLKFLAADGSGQTSDAIEALDAAFDIPQIKIINNSWGGGGASRALEDAFERARSHGILMVVAAGNDGKNNDKTASYPANIALDNVISVAAIDSAANLASFSNYGAKKVHLGAPGVNIFSTINTDSSAYDSYSGTSMAAPHVAGAAALIWGIKPSWTYQEVRQQILNSVRPTEALYKKTTTGGTLDLYRAVKDL